MLKPTLIVPDIKRGVKYGGGGANVKNHMKLHSSW